MRTLALLPAVAASLALASCTSSTPATSFDDIIKAVDFRGADLTGGHPRYIASDDFDQREKPQKDFFRGEEKYVTNQEKIDRALCLSRRWHGDQTVSDPFRSYRGWSTRTQPPVNPSDPSRVISPSSDDGTRFHDRMFSNEEYSSVAEFRDGVSTRYAIGDAEGITARRKLAKMQQLIGLPFEARTLNRHGCRDALIVFYRTSGQVLGIALYQLKDGELEMDEMLGKAPDDIEAEITSPNIHWKRQN